MHMLELSRYLDETSSTTSSVETNIIILRGIVVLRD